MFLQATPYFWENEGRGSYSNYSRRLYLEVTNHAFRRSKQRNVRMDSILALAEIAAKDQTIRNIEGDVFYIRFLGERSLDSVLIPFVLKRLVSGDIVLYAKTVWRYINENDDFYYKKGQPVFDLSFSRTGDAVIESIDPSILLKNSK